MFTIYPTKPNTVDDSITIEDHFNDRKTVVDTNNDFYCEQQDSSSFLTPSNKNNEEKEQNITNEYLDSNDEDELTSENKIYIISIDNIPHFYEESFIQAKKKMWDIATNLLKTSNDTEFGNDNFILSRNVHQVQIVCPYKFLMLNYNHILFNLRIDYVIKYDESNSEKFINK